MEKYEIKEEYVIEYINDEKTWNRLLRLDENYNAESGIEPWELYTTITYSNLSEAMTFYMTWFVSEKCYDIKLFKNLYINEELVSEEYIEPSATIKYSMRNQIDREMTDKLYKQGKHLEMVTKELETTANNIEAFLKMLHMEDKYTEFTRKLNRR